jgi:hypothetical protein
MDADARIDALYDLSLKEFVAARDALAKELSRAGDKAKAAEVKALGKPSVSAFALNQLVRRHRAAVEVFLRASDRLARAQLRAMSGTGNEADFRAATAEQREALDQLLELAPPILKEAGHPAGRNYLERIARTLRAIVLEESQRTLFEAGRLSADLEDPGFDQLAAQLGSALETAAPPARPAPPVLKVVPPPPPPPPPPKEEQARADRVRELRAAVQQAKAAEAEARKALREVEKAANSARESAESVREEVKTAEREVTEAKRLLFGAERILEERRVRMAERLKRAEQAEAEALEAREAVIAAGKAVERAQAELARAAPAS